MKTPHFSGKPFTRCRGEEILIWVVAQDPKSLTLAGGCWKIVNSIMFLSVIYFASFTYYLQSMDDWKTLGILVVGTSLVAWMVFYLMSFYSTTIVFTPTTIKIKRRWLPFWHRFSRQGGVGVSIHGHEMAAEKQGLYLRAVQLLIETLDGVYEIDLVGEVYARRVMKRIQAVNTVMNQHHSVDRGVHDRSEEQARRRPSFG